jgi:hypothetical protein
MAMSLERLSRGTSGFVGISFLGDPLVSSNGWISSIFDLNRHAWIDHGEAVRVEAISGRLCHTQMRLETSTSGNKRHSAIQVASKVCL